MHATPSTAAAVWRADASILNPPASPRPKHWPRLLCVLVFAAAFQAGEPSAVPLPPGVGADWSSATAWHETTLTRERLCLNGLWRWQPAAPSATIPPTNHWGWFKVPGIWPGITDWMQKDSQTVYVHPAWKDSSLRELSAVSKPPASVSPLWTARLSPGNCSYWDRKGPAVLANSAQPWRRSSKPAAASWRWDGLMPTPRHPSPSTSSGSRRNTSIPSSIPHAWAHPWPESAQRTCTAGIHGSSHRSRGGRPSDRRRRLGPRHQRSRRLLPADPLAIRRPPQPGAQTHLPPDRLSGEPPFGQPGCAGPASFVGPMVPAGSTRRTRLLA